MPRKRMIDPEFWSDEEIGKWSFQARLFYIALWNFADDEGRFKAHDSLLKSQIFPYDEKVDIKKLKSEIGNKVHWYVVDDKSYGHLRNFLSYQRIDKPQQSKLPIPGTFQECSKIVPRTVPPNIREENIREEKRKHLEHVLLTDKELEKLYGVFGLAQTKSWIERLNNYIGAKGTKYKSHYHTIMMWNSKIEKPQEQVKGRRGL